MSLVSRPTDLTEKVRKQMKDDERGDVLIADLLKQFDEINSFDYFNVKEVEKIMLDQAIYEYEKLGKKHEYPRDIPRFSPSSADKCERELFYKNFKTEKDGQTQYPFQRRWTRNSTAVHGAVQKQLLESEFLLENPSYKVVRMENDLPAWEKNLEDWKVITHKGVSFVLFGMMDGILDYKDGSSIGFEFKTKSVSVADIKRLKEATPSHVSQCTAYSIIFGVNEFLLTYESVAKDKWGTNENARPDMKAFYIKVTEKDRNNLLDKFARVTVNITDAEVSKPDFSKCIFCPYKDVCSGV